MVANIALTRDVVDHQVARAHPILQGSMPTAGRISIEMENFFIPFQPEAQMLTMWNGTLHLSGARLTAGGPLAEIVEVLKLPNKEVAVVTPSVAVSCKADRMFVQPLELFVGDVRVRAYGEVLFSGVMDYRVELPVTEGLVGEANYARLKGRVIRVPLIGFARKPYLDKRVLNAEVRKILDL